MRPTLVYDADCGPCTRFKNVIQFLDTRKRLDYVGLGEADFKGTLDGVPAGRRHRSFHVVSEGGLVVSGSAAFPGLLRYLPSGYLLAMMLERSLPVSHTADFLYSVFSRLHDSGSCSYRATGIQETRTSNLWHHRPVTVSFSPA